MFLGTDATIHEHISKILDRRYAVKTKAHRFHPTKLGVAIIESFDTFTSAENSLTRPVLRAKIEVDLTSVCDGRLRKRDFLSKYSAFFKSSYRNMQSNVNVVKNVLLSHTARSPDVFEPAELEGMSNFSLEPESPTIPDDPVVPSCHCGVPGCKKTVVKEGSTKGMPFFCCQQQACNFFAWDQSKENARIPQKRNAPRDRNSNPAKVKCHCGLIATESTTRGGENANRRYVHCCKSYKQCKFFEWADDDPRKRPYPSSFRSSRTRNQS